MSKPVLIKLIPLKANSFECSALMSPGHAKDRLGYASLDSVYKAIDSGKLRSVIFSKNHESKRTFVIGKDVEVLRKKRKDEARKRKLKLDRE